MNTRKNFVYPAEIEKHRKYGAALLSLPIIKPDGDWRKFLPPEEEQRRYGVEPSTCFIFAQTHTDATIEEAILGETDNDYSERFIAQFAGGTPEGGDPLKGADAIYDHGLVKEEVMPHTADLQSWEEYMSWKDIDKNKVLAEAKKDKTARERKSIVLFGRQMAVESKYFLMGEALKRTPLCISVWGVPDGDTYAPKPEGVWDTHMVEVTFVDKEKKQIHILDTYSPFRKILPENYNPDFGMGRSVQRRTPNEKKPWWITDIIREIWNFFRHPFS